MTRTRTGLLLALLGAAMLAGCGGTNGNLPFCGYECGDGTCQYCEDCVRCPDDCGACPGCGDGLCLAGEDCDSCPADCAGCGTCGDGSCDRDEGCATCPADCGTCTDCGDASCDPGEDCASCPTDCGACVECGDGTCDPEEDCESCPGDCGTCAVCGDGACSPSEDCATCPADCGVCPTCGNGPCDGAEDCASCPADCGVCPACSNRICDPGEDCANCALDCGACPGVCGDGECDPSEDCLGCPDDCGACPGVCGDGECDPSEDCATCLDDCGACVVCADGTCDATEDCLACPDDCGACPGVCGDDSCDASEGCAQCPLDCGACVVCGDGLCTADEDCLSCPADCRACPACEDGTCQANEGCQSCPQDCGPCGTCPDGVCQADEDCATCEADCGACPVCGDGTCEDGEDCAVCPVDCGACPACGDSICQASEDCASCAFDCGSCVVCGDGACEGHEDCLACPADCGACPTELDCADMLDEDQDGLTDCDDPDCAMFPACFPADTCSEILTCWGGCVGSGLACVDGCTVTGCPSARAAFAPVWDCLIVRCLFECMSDEPECSACLVSLCSDEVDACQAQACGAAEHELDCTDGLDGDDDGLVDCQDDDCVDLPVCLPETTCDDRLDNDLDQATDCGDSDCADDPYCTEPGDTCTGILLCVRDCGGDAGCNNTCADQGCPSGRDAFDELEDCTRRYCWQECLWDPDSCWPCALSQCPDEQAYCTSQTCGYIGRPPQPGDLFVNEFLPEPALGADPSCDGIASPVDDEFVEIVNYSFDVLDLSGVTLSDAVGIRHVFAAHTSLLSGHVVVIYGAGAVCTWPSGAEAVAASTGTLGLTNEGDTLTLADADGTILDSVEWGDQAAYPPIAGESYTLDPDLDQASGFTPHTSASPTGNPFSPGTTVSGGLFPLW